MEAILLGFQTLFTPMTFSFLLMGILLGLIIGSTPGLNENIAFAVFLPFSFSLPPTHALALMIGVYCATAVGGAIPAIMIKVPGTASAVLTSIDGNAMVKHGKANLALGTALFSSVFGGITSAIILLFFAPILSKFALKFGYVENFSLIILGLSAVIGMLGKNYLKGILAATIGLFIASIGLSVKTGYPRFTFNSINLYEGVPFVPTLVGLFGIAAALGLAEDIYKDRKTNKGMDKIPQIIGSFLLSKNIVKRLLPTWISSASLGNIIGVLPGAGMIMAIYLAYNKAASNYKKKFKNSQTEPQWGDGALEGIAAPETANNAVVASSMVPLLSLGIPGNSVSALFIGALMFHGMTPGPLLFMNHQNIAWMIMVSFLVANIFMAPVAIFTIKYVSGMIYKLPKILLVPVIILLCLSGSYADGNALFNIWVTLIAGFFGYMFNKVGIPQAPIILALVLGKKLEESLLNSLELSNGNWFVFVDIVNHPISFCLIIASLLFIIVPQYNRFKIRNNSGKI